MRGPGHGEVAEQYGAVVARIPQRRCVQANSAFGARFAAVDMFGEHCHVTVIGTRQPLRYERTAWPDRFDVKLWYDALASNDSRHTP